MKNLIVYKENGHPHVMVLTYSNFICRKKELSFDSIINCGHDITIASVMPDEAILPLIRASEYIRELDEEDAILDSKFLVEFLMPCIADMLDRQKLIIYDKNVASFPENFIIMQGDKVYLIKENFDFYEVNDLIVIGHNSNALYSTFLLGYNKDLPMKERIIANIKQYNNLSKDTLVTGYYFDSLNQRKEKL